MQKFLGPSPSLSCKCAPILMESNMNVTAKFNRLYIFLCLLATSGEGSLTIS